MSGKTNLGYEVRTYKEVTDHKAITKEMVLEWLHNGSDIEGVILDVPFGIFSRSYGDEFEFIAGDCDEHWHFVDTVDGYEKAAEKLFEHMKVAFPGL